MQSALQGVASISSVLTSERAIEVNILIMRAFVAMRKLISENGQIFSRLDSIEKRQITFESETLDKFNKLFNAIEENEIIPQKGIFFEGQIYNAHKFVSDIIKSAKKSIIVIDNYVDDSVLTQLSKKKKNVKVVIYSSKITKQLSLDVGRFNKQYLSFEVKELKKSHDRFIIIIIIDDNIVYHIGASLKDSGKKWFAFSKFGTEALSLIEKVKV